jgi:hypothetical protein
MQRYVSRIPLCALLWTYLRTYFTPVGSDPESRHEFCASKRPTTIHVSLVPELCLPKAYNPLHFLALYLLHPCLAALKTALALPFAARYTIHLTVVLCRY